MSAYCHGFGPCLHALTATCQSVGLPCDRPDHTAATTTEEPS